MNTAGVADAGKYAGVAESSKVIALVYSPVRYTLLPFVLNAIPSQYSSAMSPYVFDH